MNLRKGFLSLKRVLGGWFPGPLCRCSLPTSGLCAPGRNGLVLFRLFLRYGLVSKPAVRRLESDIPAGCPLRLGAGIVASLARRECGSKAVLAGKLSPNEYRREVEGGPTEVGSVCDVECNGGVFSSRNLPLGLFVLVERCSMPGTGSFKFKGSQGAGPLRYALMTGFPKPGEGSLIGSADAGEAFLVLVRSTDTGEPFLVPGADGKGLWLGADGKGTVRGGGTEEALRCPAEDIFSGCSKSGQFAVPVDRTSSECVARDDWLPTELWRDVSDRSELLPLLGSSGGRRRLFVGGARHTR